MKPFAVALCLLLPCLARPAAAQVFGQFAPAPPVALGGHAGGLYAQFNQDGLGALGQLRLSLHPGTDFGFQGGLLSRDTGPATKAALRVGGDFKVQVSNANDRFGGDVSLGAGLGLETAEGATVLKLGPTVTASRVVENTVLGRIAPYAGLGLVFSRFDGGGSSQTDLSIPLRIGAELDASQVFRLIAELEFRLSDDFTDGWQISLGANLPF